MLVFVIFVLGLSQIGICTPECQTGYYKSSTGCKKCSPSCDGGRIMIRGCTSNRDIVCECPEGKFWENQILYCKRCMPCLQGQIAVVNCTHLHDRRCVSCNTGTYTATPTACLPCKHCQKGEVTVRKCNASLDTICELVHTVQHMSNQPTKRTGSIFVYKPTPTPVIIIQKEPINILLFVFIGLLAFSLVVLCSVVICCQRRRRGSKTFSTKRTSIDTTSSENDTFINKKIVPVITHDPGYLMRKVSAAIIYDLARLLNPDGLNNWMKVASHLQFSQIDISNFAINKDRAFQTLIEVWMTQKDATVFRLYQVFLKMDRDDCASILENILMASENV